MLLCSISSILNFHMQPFSCIHFHIPINSLVIYFLAAMVKESLLIMQENINFSHKIG